MVLETALPQPWGCGRSWSRSRSRSRSRIKSMKQKQEQESRATAAERNRSRRCSQSRSRSILFCTGQSIGEAGDTLKERMESIRTPLLVLHGEEDKINLLSGSKELLKR